jgi:XRE family aerobic/anaerobic benzoate catabolism transcriptional regulator
MQIGIRRESMAISEQRESETDGAFPLLATLGVRVRTLRARRAMSRKMLARYAEVSERYLAQLEAGQGNGSILLLRRVARALGVPLAELVDDRERALEATLIDQLLDRLSPGQLTEARQLLLARFAAAPDAARHRRIALIGLRGGGKTTLGRLAGEKLGLPFLELDRSIEETSGTSLAEMFELFGQETFRRAERAALEAVLRDHPAFVLATGGSLVTEPGTFELLLASCVTVWVKADPEAHMDRVVAQGDLRPMAQNARAMDDLLSILKSREPLYARADVVIDTAGKSPEASAAELVAQISQSGEA